MNKTIGFIGCGNMGSAMVGGMINSGLINSNNIIASARSIETCNKLKEKFNIEAITSNKEVASRVDIIVLAVKPYLYEGVITEIKDVIKEGTIIVTIAAGIIIKDVENWFNLENIKIIKTMPNTPALVGEGMTAICSNKNVLKEELNYVINLFNSFGSCEVIAEKDFNAFISVCGSSPAYVYMFIEAMADAAVKQGLPRTKAYKLASQAVLGSAKMVLETGKHPGELKDMVCSPGGTTIAAVAELEKQGFRNAVISAMDKCEEKSKNM